MNNPGADGDRPFTEIHTQDHITDRKLIETGAETAHVEAEAELAVEKLQSTLRGTFFHSVERDLTRGMLVKLHAYCPNEVDDKLLGDVMGMVRSEMMMSLYKTNE